MKKTLYILSIIAAVTLAGCADFLDVKPTNKVSADEVVSSPAGVRAFLANLYYRMPIEAFDFTAESRPCPDQGYRDGFHFNDGAPNNSARYVWLLTDDCTGPEVDDIPGEAYYQWWDTAFELLHDLNEFYALIPTLESVDEDTRNELLGQSWFIRGQIYFALARRYGGIPKIEKVEPLDINNDEDLDQVIAKLRIPRMKEVETWDYVLQCFDNAAELLSVNTTDYPNHTMANRWTALAYKSRAALHAASLAKYWDRAPLTGEAVDAGCVGGFTTEDMERYYQECLDCSKEIIEKGPYKLYMPNPSSPEEATQNYIHMFQKPEDAQIETIFVKGFYKKGRKYGTNQDVWGQPAQTGGAWPHPGRMNPTIDFVDNFERYDNPGESAPIVTYEGDKLDYDDYKEDRVYYKFENPLDMFAGKDARLAAITILPNSYWRDTLILIQAGVIDMNGKIHHDITSDMKAQYMGWDGKVHYQFGAADNKFFSGFCYERGNNTRTGFSFRKYMDPTFVSSGSVWNESTTDWIDLRYAEILLNYAEACAESGLGDAGLATECLNATRRRAAFTTDIPLTIENVQRERRSELGMENSRHWDLIRRREYHQIFYGIRRGALEPILDLRDGKTFFVRTYRQYGHRSLLFKEKYYYRGIPGWNVSGLIKNPQQ